ncbi:MAG: diphthine--ammonia ligase [Thermoplasmata archaeon]|nr:diphthine--ammonia ligase [Thermoplasmata archaeon]
MHGLNVLATWSGGKDSCFASYKAMLDGANITNLVNTISEETQRVRFHGIEDTLVQAQAEAIGIPLHQIETRGDDYESDFKEGIRSLILDRNIQAMVFGDIHLEPCRKWAERICRELDIDVMEPLWNRPVKEILIDFMRSGFEACITSCQADLVSGKYVGRRLNEDLLEEIIGLGIDVCGENGEFHTVVTDGPIFKRRIDVLESQKVLRNGYWFWDIKEYELVNK